LFAREAAAMGARIVGGCCGTTPEHIRAMAGAVRGLKPAQTVKAASVSVVTPPEKARVAKRDPESGLWRKLKAGEISSFVDIDPPKGISLDRIFEQVEKITASGCVDTIDINRGTLARVGMDALMLAGALQARGIETVPHVPTLDQNLIGLQAALLGAWSIGGVRNFLAITGDPPSVGDHPETSGRSEEHT